MWWAEPSCGATSTMKCSICCNMFVCINVRSIVDAPLCVVHVCLPGLSPCVDPLINTKFYYLNTLRKLLAYLRLPTGILWSIVERVGSRYGFKTVCCCVIDAALLSPTRTL